MSNAEIIQLRTRQRPFSRKRLTAGEILTAFPAETIEQIPRQIARLNHLIAPWRQWVDEVQSSDYDVFTKWFLIQASLIMGGAPVDEIKYLARLKKLKKIMESNGADGLTELEIDAARNVPISTLMDCRKKGGRYWAVCPFHSDGNERTPSFIINSEGTGKCFSCGWFGDAIAFIRKKDGLNFFEAVKYLNKI